ncbi:hypothetical protein H2248_002296 [Termitomyces sp. 'cryptogamus']|nr:hypothetical protein H2248_002296 [Termitomyces sp. 'cryptogamus']
MPADLWTIESKMHETGFLTKITVQKFSRDLRDSDLDRLNYYAKKIRSLKEDRDQPNYVSVDGDVILSLQRCLTGKPLIPRLQSVELS